MTQTQEIKQALKLLADAIRLLPNDGDEGYTPEIAQWQDRVVEFAAQGIRRAVADMMHSLLIEEIEGDDDVD